MFCDEVQIKIKAGDGGKGLVSFRREIFVAHGGPDGGDGGDGGSIYFESDPELNTLSDFRRTKMIKAFSGQAGGRKKMRGKRGQDLVLKVPLGTIIYDKKTGGVLADLDNKNQKVLLAAGGKGGFGNAHFTSSTRQAPNFAECGEPGEEKELKLELKLIADVAIIGLPNVGKSTLLSHISKSRPKIADYPFTTLVPNLGIVRIGDLSFTACDIPGLIEGAYKGKGLGDKFLRHIERCRILIHILDVTRDDLSKDYKTINQELKKFSPVLAKKIQILVINKIDAIDSSKFKVQSSKLKKLVANHYLIFTISAVTGQGIKELLYYIKEQLEKIPKPKPVPEEVKVFRPYEKLIRIEKKDNKFIAKNAELEKLILKTDFSNNEAVARVNRILKRRGVFNDAIRAGAKPGDELKIAHQKFIIMKD